MRAAFGMSWGGWTRAWEVIITSIGCVSRVIRGGFFAGSASSAGSGSGFPFRITEDDDSSCTGSGRTLPGRPRLNSFIF